MGASDNGAPRKDAGAPDDKDDDKDDVDAPDAKPGNGGVAGAKPVTGGTGPAPSGNGDAGTTAPPQMADACEVPSCINDVVNTCMSPEGDCSMTPWEVDGSFKVCFDNGVRVETEYETDENFTMITGTVRTINPDGKTCVETIGSLQGEDVVVTWRDGDGVEIAKTTGNINEAAVTITCTGKDPVVLNEAVCGPLPDMMMGPMMMPGMGMGMGMPMCTSTKPCM